MKIFWKHRTSQAVTPRDLKFWENIHNTLCVMCHISNVTCCMSLVKCHVSGVLWHHYAQTVRAMDLKFVDNIYHPQYVICHISCVMCHMSHVMCHMSHVKCTCKDKTTTCRWRVGYQPCLPRLVFEYFNKKWSDPPDTLPCSNVIHKSWTLHYITLHNIGSSNTLHHPIQWVIQ